MKKIRNEQTSTKDNMLLLYTQQISCCHRN